MAKLHQGKHVRHLWLQGRGRQLSVVVVALVAFFALAACATAGETETQAAQASAPKISPIPADKRAYVASELIVGLSDTADDAAANAVRDGIAELGFDVTGTLFEVAGLGAMLLVNTGVDAATGADLASAAQSIAGIADISFVQPNYCCKATANAGDDAAGNQYYLDDANVKSAWDKAGSSKTVGVAVLDTGVYSMTEYEGDKLVEASSDNFHQEFSESNLDMEHARDFVHSGYSDGDPLMNDMNLTGDDNGHGTHVSAIIAAESTVSGGQGIGIAGIAPNVRIIPMKVLDMGGDGDTADIIRAYEYLVKKKQDGTLSDLRIVNMSLALTYDSDGAEAEMATVGAASDDEEANSLIVTIVTGLDDDEGDGDEGDDEGDDEGEIDIDIEGGDDGFNNTALREAIASAQNAGIVTVCAAGNESSAGLTEPSDYPECISVEALDKDGSIADYSNVNEHKDIAAPGSDILSAYALQADSYAILDGTSQATAVVSGVLALMWGEDSNMSVAQAKAALYGSADPISGQADDNGAHGAVNAAKAVEAAKSKTYGAWNSEQDELKWNQAVQEYGGSESSSGSGGESSSSTEGGSGSSSGSESSSSSGSESSSSSGSGSESSSSSGSESSSSSDSESSSTSGEGSSSSTSTKTSISKATVKLANTSYAYTGKKITPAVTVTLGGKTLKKGADYKVSYSANQNPGKATATVTGVGSYTDSKKATFTITKASLAKATVALSKTSYTYTGSACKPTTTVTLNGKTLKKGTDYTVSYSANKNPGKAKVMVKGKGAYYTGSKTASFTIKLGTTSLKKLTAAKQAFTASWARQSSGKVGYQLRYSLKKNMGSATTRTVSKNATTSLKVAKLKSGKTYYVQIRTYKKIGSKTYYSGWSAKKSVKVK